MGKSSQSARAEVEHSSYADQVPEYERPLMIVCAIAGLGPLALPLVWRHPRMNRRCKLLITIGVAALTWGCIWLTKILAMILWREWQRVLEMRI